MKCQILFFRKYKKNITKLSSAELAQRVVKVKNDSAMGSIDSCIAENIVQYTEITWFNTGTMNQLLVK